MIVLHGLGYHSTLMAPIASAFAQQGIDVLCFDTIGHGRSTGLHHNKLTAAATVPAADHKYEKPDAFVPNKELLVETGWQMVATVLKDESSSRYDANCPVFLYGQSMGGATVLEMMLLHKLFISDELFARVKGIVLEGPAIVLSDVGAFTKVLLGYVLVRKSTIII